MCLMGLPDGMGRTPTTTRGWHAPYARGYSEVADALVEIEHLRLGRWYGRRRDGETAKRCDELLGIIEGWALG